MANDIEYLNQIAQDNRAIAKKADSGFPIEPKWLKIIGAAILGVIVIMIIGSILGGLGNAERDTLDRIYARTRNLNESISEYDEKVKSSELRSMGNSLAAVLTETNSKVGNLLTSEFGADGAEPRDEAITTEEANHIQEVNSNLNYGRINGLMDRYFVREMSREIVLLMTLETDAISETDKASVKEALSSSWNNLSKLSAQFNSYANPAD